jgi:hypothetical protein
VDDLRSANAESPDLFCFLGGVIEEETALAAETDGVPREFLDFCRVLDGANCSTSMELFGLGEAEEHQFYCQPVVDSLLPLSPETLYCIGTINDTPVYLDRAGGGVLATPERQGEWPEAERLEQLADSLETFFLEQVATPEYVRLARVDDEMVEFDDWLKLLQRAGLSG